MFKVDCPGCNKPYQVDERRVPAKGLRMRCGQCGQSFDVTVPSSAEDQLSLTPGSGMPKVTVGAGDPKQTTLGLSGPKVKPLGAAGGLGPLRIAAAASVPPRPTARRRKPALPGARTAAPELELSSDLPAARSGADLPAVPPRTPPRGAEPAELEVETPEELAADELAADDLPAVFGGRGTLASPAPPKPPRDVALSLDLPAVPDSELPALSEADLALATAEPDDDLPGLPSLSEDDLELSLSFEGDTAAAAAAADRDLPGLPKSRSRDEGSVPERTGRDNARTEARGADAESMDLDELSLPDLVDASLPEVSDAGLPTVADGALPAVALSELPALAEDEFALPSLADADVLLPDSLDNRVGEFDAGDDMALDGGEFGAVDLPQIATDRLSAMPQAPEGWGSLPPQSKVAGSEPSGFELPDLEAELSANPATSRRDAAEPFGADLDFPGADPFGDHDADDLGPGGFSGPPVPSGRRSNEPSSYGEVDLGDDDEAQGAAAEGFAVDAGMEFGEIPQEDDAKAGRAGNGLNGGIETEPTSARGAAASAQVVRSQPGPRVVKSPKRSRKALFIGAAIVVVMGAAGGALAMLPRVGPFGYFYVSDLLNASAHQQLLAEARRSFVATRSSDSFSAAAAAVARVVGYQQQAPRYYPLLAYRAFAQCESVLRFGENGPMRSAAVVAMDEITRSGYEASGSPFVEARACLLATDGKLEEARALLRPAAKSGSVEAQSLLGEIDLKLADYTTALADWSAAAQSQKTPWALFGQARSLFALSKFKEAESVVDELLSLATEHSSARLLQAQLQWQRGDEVNALKAAEAMQQQAGLSPQEHALAYVLAAEIHEARGRLSRAEAAFTEALKLAPKEPVALLGLADTLYAGGRFAAAMARYDAARSIAGTALRANVGVARCQIGLEQLPAARSLLAELLKAYPDDITVRYVDGLAAAADGDRATAVADFEFAIDKGGTRDDALLARVALARLKAEMGEQDVADKMLEEAEKLLPDSALLHRTFGEVALAQGRYEKALRAFTKAKALQPTDASSLFQAAVCLRKLERFDEALKALREVEALDAQLPGLPLERGLILEKSGKGAEALAQYEQALKLAPEDLDLMMRVGCGRVSADDGAGAEEVLKAVALKRPNSAELNFCLGRALALQGQTLVALKRLQRAAELDAHRAEYFLHLGWIANEAGQVAIADHALDKALELDKGMADAYWQRGVLLLRRGAAIEAVSDLKHALALKPERYEAHAELAQAFYHLGKEDLALIEWHKAVSQDDTKPAWLFRYGKLLHSRHRNREAAKFLVRAVELGQADPKAAPWLWEAHHLAAASLGSHPDAVEHWRKFLELGPGDSPYREEAIRALAAAGKPWNGF